MGHEETLAAISKLIEQGQRYHEQGQHALSLEQYQEAITLARPLEDVALTAYLLQCAAGEHRDCDNYHHAVDLLLIALTIVQDIDELIELRASINKSLAITFKDIFGPQKPEVLQLLNEALAGCVQLGNQGQEANLLQHIGGVYVQLNRLAEADRTLTEAFDKARANNDIQLQGWILDNLAELEIERNEWGLALEYTRNARDKVCTVGDAEGEADTWITETRILVRMGQLEEAPDAAKHALELYIKNKNLRRSVRARRHIAKILVKSGQIDEAVATLHEAMKTATRLDLRHDQTILHLHLGAIELERRNYDLVDEHAVQARALAENEALEDLVVEADYLLQHNRSKGNKRV